ncbi:hypothetical protein B4N90_11360, partial [Acinetobacter baumannii]
MWVGPKRVKKVSKAPERHEILEQLKQQNYVVDDLSDDEVAKLHIRYLIGGHANLDDERLFRVEFPERPGALL